MSRTGRTSRRSSRPVLIVQHARHEHPAALRRALESQGILTHWIHPYHGERYPEVTELGGMISLGGPMGANDEVEHPWIVREVELLREAVSHGLPVAGICLGGQMLARALGAKVERHHTPEVGWFPLEVTPAGQGDPVLGAAGASPMVYHWHGDTFHLPKGAELLARSKVCERQAYRMSERVYGFQFHPEADHQLVLEWLSIEGVESDIREFRRKPGGCMVSVQEARLQRSIALKGEKASLKITAAIGALFREQEAGNAPSGLLADVQAWATHRETVRLEFPGSRGAPVHLRGTIESLLSIPAGEFLILADENTLLWPIRLDDISRIEPAPAKAPLAAPLRRAPARRRALTTGTQRGRKRA